LSFGSLRNMSERKLDSADIGGNVLPHLPVPRVNGLGEDAVYVYERAGQAVHLGIGEKLGGAPGVSLLMRSAQA